MDTARIADIVRATIPKVLSGCACRQKAAPIPPRLEKYVRLLKALRPKQAELHEADMEQAMQAFFQKQARAILKNLGDVEAAPSSVDLLYRPGEWVDELKEAARPPLERAVLTGYLTAKAIAKDRDKEARKATELAEDLAEGTFLEGWELPASVARGIEAAVETVLIQPYWERILAETGRQLAGTMARAMEEEWSEADLKAQIKRDIGDVDGVRSKLIARTEMTGAMNAGQQVQMQESEDAGLTVLKMWVTVGDILVRDTHREANGQEVQGANADFVVGGFEAPWPGHWTLPAEERCNCRCTSIEDLAELREGGFTEKPQLLGNEDDQLDIQVQG